MGTISARVPDDLEAAFEEFVEEENLDRSTAVRKLLAEGLDDWREQRALEKLESGEVSFARAAELADRSVWEFATLAKDHDVTWVGRDGVESDLDSL
jgi:predicted HTH domain antitoxin